MTKHRDLSYGGPLPEMVMDGLMELLGTYASPNFQVTLLTTTSIRVAASADNGQVGIAINGRWRYNTANADATHPGGSAGTYDIYVTGSDNSVSGAPEVDSTVYAFGLAIRATGSPPVTALYRKIGTVTWDGTAITRIYSDVSTPTLATADFLATVPATAAANTVKPTANVVPLTVGQTAGHTANRLEVRDSSNALVLGVSTAGLLSASGVTLLSATGKVTQRVAAATSTQVVDIGVTGDATARLSVLASGSLQWSAGSGSADVTLARSAAATLALTGSLTADGLSVTASAGLIQKMGGATTGTAAAQFGVTGDTIPRLRVLANGTLEWGAGVAAATDVSLSRPSAGRLAVNGSLAVNPGGPSGGTTADGLLFGPNAVALYSPAASQLQVGGRMIADILQVGAQTLDDTTVTLDTGSVTALVASGHLGAVGMIRADGVVVEGGGDSNAAAITLLAGPAFGGGGSITFGSPHPTLAQETAVEAGQHLVIARVQAFSAGAAATRLTMGVTSSTGLVLLDAVTSAHLVASGYLPTNFDTNLVVVGYVTLAAGAVVEVRAATDSGSASISVSAFRASISIARIGTV